MDLFSFVPILGRAFDLGKEALTRHVSSSPLIDVEAEREESGRIGVSVVIYNRAPRMLFLRRVMLLQPAVLELKEDVCEPGFGHNGVFYQWTHVRQGRTLTLDDEIEPYASGNFPTSSRYFWIDGSTVVTGYICLRLEVSHDRNSSRVSHRKIWAEIRPI